MTQVAMFSRFHLYCSIIGASFVRFIHGCNTSDVNVGKLKRVFVNPKKILKDVISASKYYPSLA